MAETAIDGRKTQASVLKAARTSRGYTLAQMAEFLTERGCPVVPSTYMRWERGIGRPALPGLLSEILGVPLRALVD